MASAATSIRPVAPAAAYPATSAAAMPVTIPATVRARRARFTSRLPGSVQSWLARSVRISVSASAAIRESALVIGYVLYLARRNRPVSVSARLDLTSPARVARASTSAGVSATAGADPAAANPRSIAA